MITGVTAMIAGPVAGKLSDTLGKYKLFLISSVLGMSVMLYYSHLGRTPLWQVIIVSSLLFACISARIVSASALMSAVPSPQDRGAFMGVSSAFQQISGGIASAIAGAIVVKTPSGFLERYDVLGYVVFGAMLVTIVMMYVIHKMVSEGDARN